MTINRTFYSEPELQAKINALEEENRELKKLRVENIIAKTLLSMAIKDMNGIIRNVASKGYVCGDECSELGVCEKSWFYNDKRVLHCRDYKWRYADEAEKLLGDDP